jgi:hypothetical protein
MSLLRCLLPTEAALALAADRPDPVHLTTWKDHQRTMHALGIARLDRGTEAQITTRARGRATSLYRDSPMR